MYHIVEVITFIDSPGTFASEAAEIFAKHLCMVNGIVFKNGISCDGIPVKYSVQIVESINVGSKY